MDTFSISLGLDTFAIILGTFAGAVIMIISLVRRRGRYWGLLSAAISWGLAWLAYSPGSADPNLVILMIFMACGLYVGATWRGRDGH